MPRNLSMNIHYECDVTNLDVSRLVSWCRNYFKGNYNVIADSGSRAARGDGSHYVMLLCDNFDDWCFFKLTWFESPQ